jgi:membrane fusion protein (multidrug efflux system)
MKRAIAFTFVFLLLAGLAGGLAWVQFVMKPQMIKGFISKAPPPVTSVAVAQAKQESWTPRLPAIGTFRAVQGIDIAPQVAGVVKSLSFDSGEDVEKGAVLVQLENNVEEADLASNEATLKNAELALQRQRQLVSSAATTKASLDAAQATRDTAAAAVDRVKALIAQKKLTAPFAGRLGLRKVDLGQYVSPGTSIVTLQQLDPIFVDFPIPEKNVDELKAGQEIEVTVDAYPGHVFKGKIVSIDARIDPNTRNVSVRAQVENNEKSLLPGMFANVAVLAGEPKDVVTLPRTAVSYSLYGDSVFALKPRPPQPGEAQAAPAPGDEVFVADRRFVRIGDTRGDRVSVLDGVKPGERVVSEGQVKLTPNALVRIAPDAGLKPSQTLPKE